MVSQTVAPGAAVKTLSSNQAVQLILADVPIFTVGILAFGTLTFFFLMKRVDRWVLALHISVLFAFLAALLDLSQILLLGNSATRFASDADRLITAREVFYSFASGLRLFFYWGFVAMIPLGETIPEGINMHSGSWRRWGPLGRILKWFTFLLIFISTILQLVYRNVPAVERIGPAYEAEAALEIILSAIFILKLLLNIWARFPAGSTTPSKGKMVVQYLPAIVALLFSMWIAVGNVILFEFTETALGRFMRALELYVLLIYMLTISFHHLRHLSFYPVIRPRAKRASQITNYKRSSIEKSVSVRAADFPQPPSAVNLMQILQARYRDAQEIPQTVERSSERSLRVESAHQHQSMAARLSTWLGMSRALPGSSAPQAQQAQQSWDVDAERGSSPITVQPWVAKDARMETPSILVLDSDGPVASPSTRDEQGEHERPLSPTSDTQSRKSTKPADGLQIQIPPTPVPERDWQDLEYSNAQRYSGIGVSVVANALQRQSNSSQSPEDDSRDASSLNIEVVAPQSDDGSIRNSVAESHIDSPYPMSPLDSAATPIPRSRPLPPMPGRPSSMLDSPISPRPADSARSSNVSILIRKQDELDRSIEALKLFSPSKVSFNTGVVSESPPVDSSSLYSNMGAQYLERRPRNLSPIPSEDVPDSLAPSPNPMGLTSRADDGDETPQPSALGDEFDFGRHRPPLDRASTDSGVMPAGMAGVQAQALQARFVATDERRLEIRPDSSMQELVPPRMPVSRFSDSSSVGDRRERTDSHGTQYDITSFVGNLFVPGDPKDSIQSASSAMFSEEGVIGVATQRMQRVARPTLITQLSRTPSVGAGINARVPVPLPSQPSAGGEGETSPPSPTPVARRALPQVPAAAASSADVAGQAGNGAARFRRAVGLPARPRLSVVNLTPVEEKTMATVAATAGATTSPGAVSDSATLVSPASGGAGTPMTGKAW